MKRLVLVKAINEAWMLISILTLPALVSVAFAKPPRRAQ
jgi:hypothetical protein